MTGAKCPICGKTADAGMSPFCSKRCADIDLSRWLKGGYAIPGKTAGQDEDEAEIPQKTPQNGHSEVED